MFDVDKRGSVHATKVMRLEHFDKLLVCLCMKAYKLIYFTS